MSTWRPELWPEVLEALPASGPVCIEASAGTGKTFTLEHLLLQLIVEVGVPIEKVLVVTFTEKATLELVARLRERLLETRNRLARLQGQEAAELQQPLRRVERALRDYDRAHISTIHGFCKETLAEGAMPAGMLLEHQLVPPHTVEREVLLEQVRARITGDDATGLALRTFLTRHGFEALLTLHRAVAGEHGTLLPGFDLSAFAAAMDDYPDPEEIEAWVAAKGLSGIRAPARTLLPEGLLELPEVVATLTTPEAALRPDNPWRQWGETPIGASTRFQVAATWLQKPKVRATPVGERLARAYFDLLDHAPLPAAFLAGRFFGEVRALAAARKRALGLLDYDDMLTRLDAALEGPIGAELRAAVRERFTWVLIDEFQDTDALQWGIFRRLFESEGPDDPHRIVVVGDPKQAIYGFRGGDLPVYVAARDEIVAAGNPLRHLEVSFRSSPRLLSVLGPLFEVDYFAPEVEAPALGHPPEYDTLTEGGADLPPVTLLAAPDDAGAWPLGKRDTAAALQDALVAELSKLTDPRRPVLYQRKGRAPRPLRHGDCMVLCLTGAECEAVGRRLGAAGIPHAFFKQAGLSGSDEAEHLRILLAALADPGDPSARARLWLTPFFALPLAKVEAARELAATDPLHALPLRWSELAAERRFETLFDAVLVESGLRERLAAAGDERALTNYLHLCERLLEAAREAPLAVQDLARALKPDGAPGEGEDADLRRLETERDAVQILTLHKAKGLEAPVVLFGSTPFARNSLGLTPRFDTGCDIFHAGEPLERVARLPTRYLEKQKNPERDEAIEAEALAERLRLFYVAATRARVKLVVPAALRSLGDPDAKKGLAFTRGYEALNRRLAGLAETPALAPLFELRDLREHLAGAPDPAAPEAADPGRPPLPEDAPALEGAQLRRDRRAPVLTSYSRMKRGTDGLAPTELTARPPLDELAERAPAGLESDPVLPGGIRTGLFLHTLLEETDFGQVAAADSLEAFLEDEARGELAARLAARHGLPRGAARRGLELAYTTLRRPLRLGEIHLPEGLCAVGRHRPELPFVYPIPELAHPLLEGRGARGGADPLPYRVDRGFVTGVIDLVFEVEDRVFFLDWKSDRLADYAPAALAEHVERNYALQARLYALAVARLYGLQDAEAYARRFGGLAYLYLRGPEPGGLHFERPAWSELVEWESGLLTHAERAIARGERAAAPLTGEERP